MKNFKITDLSRDDDSAIRQTAEILWEAFQDRAVEWPTLEACELYVHQSVAQTQPERINLVAVGEDGRVIGYIGGVDEGNHFLWQLDPLAVRDGFRGQGIGRALVAELEPRVRDRGALTLWLGTDDWNHVTSIGELELYPDVISHLAEIRNLDGHPYQFYEKMGFVIVGAIPDANGPGKPDILMAKRVAAK